MIKSIKNNKGIKLRFIPIILLLGIVPLLTRLKIITSTTEVARIHKQQAIADFFSYYKASFILIIGLSMLIVAFFTFSKQDIKRYKDLALYVGTAGFFGICTLLSTLFSPYKDVALWGIPGRMEGLFIILTYVVMMFYAIYIMKKVEDYRYIIYSLSFLIFVLTILGIFEYRGQNLLTSTELGKNILFPKEYAAYKQNLRLEYSRGKVYGTLYHYNYMGSFAALMVPLFITLTLGLKDKKKRLYCGFFTIASLFLLFGSTSRGGLIGVFIAFIIGIVIFQKGLFKNWKIASLGLAVMMIFVVGLNGLTHGTIFERVPALLHDIKISLQKSELDYKDYLPIREVKELEGKVTLVTQKDTLKVSSKGGYLALYDQEGQTVSYIDQDEKLIITDEPFKGFSFRKLYDSAGNWAAISLNIDGVDSFIFKIDEEKGLYPIDSYTQQKEKIVEAESWGFKGKERLGSSRGYIWSRSLPMLKKTWLIGDGPNTYSLDFPQNDYLAKWYAYGTPHMIVDKPHNLYLQIGINQGLIALSAFLALVMTYIVESLKLYAFRRSYEKGQIIGVATVLSIIGYLGAGIFNDSVVAVAPVFWILLGIGISMNQINKGTTC